MERGETVFWSRSRRELWHKGATSGNTQKLVELRYDCDADTLLALAHPAGPACHTGERSCFFLRHGLGPPRAEALSHIALLDDEACPNLHRNSTICGLMCLNDRGSCANMIEVLNIPPLESHLTSNIPLQACTRALARVSKQIYP